MISHPRFVLISVASALLLAAPVVVRARRARPPHPTLRVLYTETPAWQPFAWMTGADRFPQGAQLRITSEQDSQALPAGFAATADAAMSFDGQGYFFAGKRKTGEPWQVWFQPLNGEAPVQWTQSAEDCVRPLPLPEGHIVYAAKRNGRYALVTQTAAGSAAQQLSFGSGNAMPEAVLADGRILFTAPFPLGATSGQPELYTVYSDGTGGEAVRCDHAKAHRFPSESSSGNLLFAGGEGIAQFSPASPALQTVRSLRGEIGSPLVELPAGEWLLSWRATARSRFALATLSRQDAGSTPQTFWTGKGDLVQPVVVAARPVPPRFPSARHDWDGANLLCLNVYESPLPLRCGSVAQVRVRAQEDNGRVRVLGTSRVHPDGSFYLHLPHDRPLQMELLDANGHAVAAEKGWFWMRRGEQRVCIGCHAGPERAPDNHVPAVLEESTTPVDLTHQEGR